MTHFYNIYGLSVSSSRKIELLNELVKPSLVDLSVTWASERAAIPNAGLFWHRVITRQLSAKQRILFFSAESNSGTYLKLTFITAHGDLSVLMDPDKKNVWIIHSDTEPVSNMNSLFVGSILGCILRLRGILCLHGSVINIDGQAVIFTGKKKSGKSTTATAFSRLGYKVMADDIAVINEANGNFVVQPGYAKVRLRPQPLEVFYPENTYAFDSVYSHRDSKYSDLAGSFHSTPLKLGAIYLLGETEETDGAPFVTPTSAERLVQLHSNTFAGYVLTPDQQKAEFEILGRLSLKVQVKHLHFGRNVKLVYQQCSVVLDDFKKQV